MTLNGLSGEANFAVIEKTTDFSQWLYVDFEPALSISYDKNVEKNKIATG